MNYPRYNQPNASPFSSFSTNQVSYGDRGFAESNSLIAKFAFLFLVIFAFIVLLRVGIVMVSYLFKQTDSPKLINGMVDAKQLIVFPQQPSTKGAATIYRSVNASDGIEFTWSVWIFIDNLVYKDGFYKHIFYKGNSDGLETNGLNFPNNAPGLYIAPKTNALVVMMNTFDVINEEIVIPDIPLNKWLNVIIRCQNNTLDVYINGTVSRSVELTGVPKQNYGEVYVGMNGGFDGYISNLWYYNYALGTAEIHKLASKGPNTKMTGTNGVNSKNTDYLSTRWFFYGAGDGYNP
jgi:Concanavalin A-like lectin/glucanases superfamily